MEFLSEIGIKKHTFWHLEWGRILAPNSGDQEPWNYMYYDNDIRCLQYSSGGFSQTHRSRWGIKLSGED